MSSADAVDLQFSTAYRFVFTAVRGDGRSIQLGEVRLYDSDGNAVAISSASNPDGDNPPAQRAANVIDGDLGTKPSSKWLDGRMSETGRSTLDLELASPAGNGTAFALPRLHAALARASLLVFALSSFKFAS